MRPSGAAPSLFFILLKVQQLLLLDAHLQMVSTWPAE